MKMRYDGNNRIRKFIDRYFLPVLSVLSLELAINLFPSGSSSFVKKHERFLGRSFEGSFALFQYVKMNVNYLCSDYDENLFRNAVRNEESISQIKKLFFEDVEKDYTEVGGILTIDKSGRLNLYEVESEFSDVLSKLDSYRNDYHGFIKFYEENKKTFDEIEKVEYEETGFRTDAASRVMDLLKNEEKGEDVKLRVLNSLINIYKLMGDNTYSFRLGDYLSKNLVEGSYIGNFHLHTLWMEPPSDNDLERSKGRREFVFVLNERGFDVYVLEEGEIIDKVEYRSDGWRTFIETLRRVTVKKGYRGGNLLATQE